MVYEANSDPVEAFKATYGRAEGDLFGSDVMNVPGKYSGEEEFIRFAASDYHTDRHWAFEIKPEETALIVIDLQEDFVNPGNPMFVPEAYRQIPRTLALIDSCREAGVKIFYTEHHIPQDASADFYEYWEPIAAGAIKEGEQNTKLYHGLDPLPGERIIDVKHAYDSFAGTNLDYVLRANRIRTVIVCGTITNFCVESTARTAYFLNYHVVVGSDVSASDNAMAHEASLMTLRRGFARVMDHQEIAGAFAGGDPLYHEAIRERANLKAVS